MATHELDTKAPSKIDATGTKKKSPKKAKVAPQIEVPLTDAPDLEKGLPQKTQVAVAIEAKMKTIEEDPDKTNLEKMVITKEMFEEIKRSLADTIKSMEKNPSIFSRAAEFWGELPLWQKILGGIAITVPTLIAGIVLNIGFLLAICGVTTVTYAAGGIILDDHHKCSVSVTESLQKGILGLAELLELTINALDIIRQQLEVELGRFVKENDRLTQNIDGLSQEIDSLDVQVSRAVKMTKSLGRTKQVMEQFLHDNVTQHTELLEQAKQKLARFNEAYSACQSDLAEKIAEVNKVREDFATEVDKAKLINESLQEFNTELLKQSRLDADQQEQFRLKLVDFVTNKEASFLQIVARFGEAEKKLEATQKQLDLANERYNELLDIQEGQIDRLQGLPSPSVAKALSQHGLHAVKKGTGVPGIGDPDPSLEQVVQTI